MNVLSFPNHTTPKTLKEEKKYITLGLKQKLLDRHVWHVISWSWFTQWKDYVEFDNPFDDSNDNGDNNKDRECLKPGPIDNTMIRSDVYEEELRVNLMEGLDYVLLPEAHGKYLYEKYKGGPFFKRTVINIATMDNPLLQIELYPIRIEIYYTDKYKSVTVQDVNQFILKQDQLLLLKKNSSSNNSSSGNGSSGSKNSIDHHHNASADAATTTNNTTATNGSASAPVSTSVTTTTPAKINSAISNAFSTLTTSVTNGIHLVTNSNNTTANNTINNNTTTSSNNNTNNTNMLSTPTTTYSTITASKNTTTTTNSTASTAIIKPHIQYVSKKERYDVVTKTYQQNTIRQYRGGCRGWVRYPYKPQHTEQPQCMTGGNSSSNSNDINGDSAYNHHVDMSDNKDMNNMDITTATTVTSVTSGRKFTRDMTDWDANFKCVRPYSKSLTFYDLLITTTTSNANDLTDAQSLQQQQQQQQASVNSSNHHHHHHHHDDSTNIDDIHLVGIDNNRVILLIEYSDAVNNISTQSSNNSSSNTNNESSYPRASILNKWKSQLRVGDIVDACDKNNKWYESVIVKIHSPPSPAANTHATAGSGTSSSSSSSSSVNTTVITGVTAATATSTNYSCTIHFKGWEHKYDEIFSKIEQLNKLQPLFTRTADWRSALQENDPVEVNIGFSVSKNTSGVEDSNNNSSSSSSSRNKKNNVSATATTTTTTTMMTTGTNNNNSNNSNNDINEASNNDLMNVDTHTASLHLHSVNASPSTTQPVSLPAAWWIQGEVEEVDLAGSRVLVKLLKSDLAAVLLHNAQQKGLSATNSVTTSSTVNTATSTTAGSVDVDIDMMMDVDSIGSSGVKSNDNTTTTNTATATMTTTSTVDSLGTMKMDNTTAATNGSAAAGGATGATGGGTESEEMYLKQWYDLYGELISPLHTHITPLKKPSTLSSHITSLTGGSGSSGGTGGFQMGSPSRFKTSVPLSAASTALSSSLLNRNSNGNFNNKFTSSSSSSSAFNISGSNKKNKDDDDDDDGGGYGDNNVQGKSIAKGVVGLQNLGNTCFMNSVLQCLSNTYALTEYFLEGKYKQEINVDNALGHGGKLAQVYAKLIRELWSDAYTKVIPRAFKKTIGEFQPQFAGYQQQDSQELMGFLLDGLHEDLNRRLKKPAVSKIESNGRSDELIARESWRRFLLRNDSLLVDKVYGQLRSHVTCMNCGKESVTFDPFNTLSLPVPIKTAKPLTVLFRPLGSLVPLRVTVDIEMTDQIKDVKMKVITKLLKLNKIQLPSSSSSLSTSTFQSIHNNNNNNNNSNSGNPNQPSVAAAIVDMSGSSAASGGSGGGVVVEGDEDSDGYVKIDLTTTTATTTSNNSHSNNNSDNSINSTTANITTTTATTTHTSTTHPTTTAADRVKVQLIDYLLHRTHAASMNSYNQTKINKSLSDKCPAAEFTHGRELIVLYQLLHPCDLKNTNMIHSTISSSSSSSSFNKRLNTSDGENDDDDDDEKKKNGMAVSDIQYTYMDMYNGKLSQTSPIISAAAYIDTYGLPMRFNIITDMTGLELYELVWNQVRRFVKPDSIYYHNTVTTTAATALSDIHSNNKSNNNSINESIISTSSSNGSSSSSGSGMTKAADGEEEGSTNAMSHTYEFPFHLITSSIWANGVKSIIQPYATITASTATATSDHINGNHINTTRDNDITTNITTTTSNRVCIVEGEVLICCWKKEADTITHFDRLEFDKVEEIGLNDDDDEEEDEELTKDVVNDTSSSSSSSSNTSSTSSSSSNSSSSSSSSNMSTPMHIESSSSSSLLSSPLNRAAISTPTSPLPNSDKKRLKAHNNNSNNNNSEISSSSSVRSTDFSTAASTTHIHNLNSDDLVNNSNDDDDDEEEEDSSTPMRVDTTTASTATANNHHKNQSTSFIHGNNNTDITSRHTTNNSTTTSSSSSSSKSTKNISKSDKNNKKLSVYKCLDKFVEREQLNPDETLYCSQCKQHLAPVKKMDLWAVPDILIIQLKRFQYIPGQYFVHREKINDLIDFPLTGLNLSPYVLGPQSPTAPPVYDLYAVSLHSGGLGGGHYTAVAQNSLNGKWYNFNDSYVSETSASTAVCEQSYVLFYKRQQGSLQWAGVVPLEDPGLPDEE